MKLPEVQAARRKKQSPSGSTASRKNADDDEEIEATTKKKPLSKTKGASSKQFKSAVMSTYATENYLLIARKEFLSSDVEPEGGKGKASKKPTSTGRRRVELRQSPDAGESSEAEVIIIRPKNEVKNDEVE